jgi:hypothetical protein
MQKSGMDSGLNMQQTTAEQAPISRYWRRVISGLLLIHIVIVVLANWTAVPPESPLRDSFRESIVYPYVVATSLNQGYRFFAPDPGPSHVIKFEIFDDQGKPIKLAGDEDTIGYLPPINLRVGLLSGKPRLLYHRYFMLTEQVPNMPHPDMPPEAVAKNEVRLKITMNSYAQELMRRNNGARIKLTYLMHMPPNPDDFLEHKQSMTDPDSYVTLWSGEFTRDLEKKPEP